MTHSAEIARLLERMLEAGGYVPDVATRADALVRTASITHPALVLLDCDHDAIHHVESLPSAVRASIALFSPSRLPDEVRLVGERHGLPCLMLPVGPRALLRFVDATIEERSERSASRGRTSEDEEDDGNSDAA